MSRFAALMVPVCVAASLAACSQDKPKPGLPPAQAIGVPGGAVAGTPVPGANPHAMGAGPHAGMGTADPHAGMNMGGADPHAGMNMGSPDVTAMGLPAPDPARTINPNNFVRGVIRVDGAAKGKTVAGTPIFITVKRAAADGAPQGPPLAVEKLAMTGDLVPFNLTEAQAMIAGTSLTGDVVVSARYDQDGDAISKQPGDVTGSVRVTIPAKDIDLVLSTVLP